MENKLELTPALQMLIDTTEQLIIERGCRGATIREIMNRTNMSMGGIYHYVKSKDELFGIILESKLHKIDEQFQQAVSRAQLGELTGPLQAIIDGFLMYLTSGNKVVQQIFVYLLSHQDNEAIGAVLTRFHNSWVEANKKWIKIGQQAGAIPAFINAEESASAVVAIYMGLLIKDLLGVEQMDQANVYGLLSTVLQNEWQRNEGR